MLDLNKYKQKIIAHRGIHDNKIVPENSIKSFELAIKENIPIELDIHLTKDNKLVVFHDKNLKRMTGVNKIIEELTLEEIKKLKLLNTKEEIPTLEEVLSLVNEKVLIDIEVKVNKKHKKIANELIYTLESYNGNIIIKSFNPNLVKEIKKRTNKYNVGLLIDYNSKSRLINLISKTNIFIYYCKPDFLGVNKKIINTKNIKKYLNKLPIMIWTIKKPEEIDNKNFIYICNNLPYKENKTISIK